MYVTCSAWDLPVPTNEKSCAKKKKESKNQPNKNRRKRKERKRKKRKIINCYVRYLLGDTVTHVRISCQIMFVTVSQLRA